jgi:hypothetical protein
MHDAVGMLQDYLLPHLAAEEAVLFPAAERELAPCPASVTQALTREHEIMRLWIHELETLADQSAPDPPCIRPTGRAASGVDRSPLRCRGGRALPDHRSRRAPVPAAGSGKTLKLPTRRRLVRPPGRTLPDVASDPGSAPADASREVPVPEPLPGLASQP